MNPTTPQPVLPRRRPELLRNGAFSLIELLTVIAIIGVLAAILTPVLGRVRESSKSTRCVTNLRQAGVAIQAYASDNKGSLPPAGFFGISAYYNKDPRNFQNSLLPYLSLTAATTWSTTTIADMAHSAVLDCPSYKGAEGGKCYTLQQTVTAADGTQFKPWGLVADVYGTVKPKPLKIATLPDNAWAMRDSEPSATELSHSDARNTLFFDGHVARVVAVNN